MTETTPTDFKRKRNFIGMEETDLRALRSITDLIDREIPEALEGLYRKIGAAPDTKKFFPTPAHMEHAKQAQVTHWHRIAEARFNQHYVDNVSRIGAAHARIGLEPGLYIGAYGVVMEHLFKAIIRNTSTGNIFSRLSPRSKDTLTERLVALSKAILLEIDLTISTYLRDVDKARLEMQAEQTRRAEEDKAAVQILGEALSALANGDLTRRISDNDFPERLAALKLHFNQTAATLSETINNISSETTNILTNAHDIRHGAEQLSNRTEQQAAAGEEMSATLGQIAERIGQTAQQTLKTDKLVSVAWQEAKHAEQVKNDTISAMAAVEDSSQKIGGIISIINEIAFQTNLLALNASVEAARAGDVGKGFAVVAYEVRNLSQRSREAAEAIGALIAQSDQQVRSGAAKVRETGNALQKVMEQVEAISNAVSTIAAATQEQSQSISELNSAMSGLEQTTMQNAGAAEESAEAVGNLVATADTLARAVSRFNTVTFTGERVPSAGNAELTTSF
ncbi:globin-coupled sensor protein [Asaia sp. HN010]|uniref:globin-coupled sensor protein n=1 Tax=Asaia sp. HN010 TaxID=3081233 RepID=UPI00301AB5BA